MWDLAIPLTEIIAVVLGAALALLVLEYQGVDVLRFFLGGARGASTADGAAADASPSGPTRSRRAIEVLRILIGVVWLANLLFVVDPANNYWSTFGSAAQSYGPTSLGGTAFANYVAANPTFFAWLIALATAYLAIALILGVTTRLALLVGSAASVVFLVTQFGSTFVFPGGTDVGAHPLYLVIYAALWIGGAGQSLSVDGLLWKRGWGRKVPAAEYFASPSPIGTAKPSLSAAVPHAR